MATHLALARVEFEYQAQTEDEISVQEDQVVWVLEDDDPESVSASSSPPPFHPTRPACVHYLTEH